MYCNSPILREATHRLWAYIRDALVASGVTDIPEKLDWTNHYESPWLRKDLVLAQTCGYPYVRKLRGHVRLIATPEYTHQGCEGPAMCSLVVVHKSAPFHDIIDLKGSRAAINHPESNSGANLFRALVAPYAAREPFFSSVIETGSHDASITAVARGLADVAAIDCITFGNIARFNQDFLKDVRVVVETPKGPGLPFITRPDASDAEVSLIREILRSALNERLMANTIDALSIGGFHFLDDQDYEQLSDFERDASLLGYPNLC